MTITQDSSSVQNIQDEILTLTLAPRPSVRWEEGVIDNEGLGRKSSKRCCIFHKQRGFGESSTDSSDSDASNSSGSSSDGGPSNKANPGNNKKIARKKRSVVKKNEKQNKVPDYQRFHA
eukprot:CAMPEP_0194360586 /NCGR_PEP_ID=MMETSP0174-20130528/7933_1 /TAXON_ID=216777 /ORGANISM="Proboscia alata, Strain PI-D3" /LENGTH=118 /DNA_ID=CAMNT_0039132155 /DNA_START=186 /DNA_END=542 /DNA_ORIENTATION=-